MIANLSLWVRNGYLLRDLTTKNMADFFDRYHNESIPKDEIYSLRNQNWTLEQIGRKFGISKQRISQLIGGSKKKYERIDFNYHCERCNKDFYSHLSLQDAICIKCGSEKIKPFSNTTVQSV
jgi:hypothetical protein